jgi:hypothetical protein
MTQGKKLSDKEKLVMDQWIKIADEARVVVRPFLTSTYELCDETQQVRAFGAPPLYHSTAGKHWLCMWCARLMSLAHGDEALLFRSVCVVCGFDACILSADMCRSATRGVFKTSTSVAAFLLPYMVCFVLFFCRV